MLNPLIFTPGFRPVSSRLTQTDPNITEVSENSAEAGKSSAKVSEQTEKRDGAVFSCGIKCVTIIGQVEGHNLLSENQKTTKYEHLLPELFELEREPSVRGVLFLLNTAGGDVEAGLALAETIASMSKRTASLVLGGGHSIGIPLATAAQRSFIVPSATMTLHPARLSGVVIGSPQTYFYFERIQNRIISFIAGHSLASEEKLRSLMLATDQLSADTGTILSGEEAVKVGIIDQIGGLSDAVKWLEG